ncbi:serine hydrolase domain-containing protein [Congregibacter brevis]|uniref:Serine hydrolase domain-containing protein n=1 Tax=Congregibacter brevis TaxID=3081201 RepID=A0ABZ0IFV2_9GAMM|nr:serine hydrolase domain-containing protein [Congregibacter sp. IMCC45268]
MSPTVRPNDSTALYKSKRSLAAIIALVLASAFAVAQAGDPPIGESASTISDLTPMENPDVQASIRLFSAWLEGQIAQRELPGIVVGLVKGDDLIWSKGFGYADLSNKRPMTDDTRFRMASHSKLFTATAIMQLREKGLLRLDDPVSDYLPWFEFKTATADDPAVTVEHLLTHSSGLPREAGTHWSDYEFPTKKELQALLPERQAAFSPEVRWKYSNLAYALAGMIVETVSGQSWPAYLQDNIFDPLAMSASSVDAEDPQLATGYGRRIPNQEREVMPFVDARSMSSATGLTSTIEDMAAFVSAQFREGPRGDNRILSTASLREMHRVRMLENDWTRGQGIGFSVMRVGDKLQVGHGGGYPGYTTHTRIQLDDEIGAIVLTNTLDSYPSQLSAQLMETVGTAVAKATKTDSEKRWDPEWARFAGIYRSPWGDFQVVEMNEELVLININAPRLKIRSTLEPLTGDTFVIKAETGGGPVGEVTRFVEENGRVTRMINGDSYMERIDP